MGKILYKKEIGNNIQSLIFSQDGGYLAVHFSDGKYLYLRFDKVRIHLEINRRQAMYINYTLHGEKIFAKYLPVVNIHNKEVL
jgi:hypothetical protein